MEIAENGNQAVDAVRRNAYDVVLMDVQMPELDGVAATREIRALPLTQIRYSHYRAHRQRRMMGDEKEYLEAGMTDYISKPIGTDVLFVKLAQIARKAVTHQPDVLPDEWEDAADPQNADHAELPLLDLEKLASLTSSLPMSDVRDLLRLFMLDTDKHIADMREQNAGGNLDGVGRNAHVIVSTAGNMGASRLYALARALDSACRAGDDVSMKELVGEMAAVNVRTADAIREWMESGSVRQIA